MPIIALLEIGAEPSGELPISLLTAGYRATCAGYAVCALRGVSSQAVDRALDPLISTAPFWRMNGVVYRDATDESFVCAVARRTRIVVAVTDEMRTVLTAQGIRYFGVAEAIVRLRELEPVVSAPDGAPRASAAASDPAIA